MKLGILDYMIIILSIAIVGAGYVLFIADDKDIFSTIGIPFNSVTYTVTFDLNGADSISANSVTCNNTKDGCVATLPTARRNNGSIIGFSLNPNDKNAQYKENESITLNSDMNLYVISYKNRTIKIDSSDVDFIEKKEVSCQTFNKESECQVELPHFNKVGYQIVGYSTTKNNKTGYSVAAGKNISVALHATNANIIKLFTFLIFSFILIDIFFLLSIEIIKIYFVNKKTQAKMYSR